MHSQQQQQQDFELHFWFVIETLKCLSEVWNIIEIFRNIFFCNQPTGHVTAVFFSVPTISSCTKHTHSWPQPSSVTRQLAPINNLGGTLQPTPPSSPLCCAANVQPFSLCKCDDCPAVVSKSQSIGATIVDDGEVQVKRWTSVCLFKSVSTLSISPVCNKKALASTEKAHFHRLPNCAVATNFRKNPSQLHYCSSLATAALEHFKLSSVPSLSFSSALFSKNQHRQFTLPLSALVVGVYRSCLLHFSLFVFESILCVCIYCTRCKW